MSARYAKLGADPVKRRFRTPDRRQMRDLLEGKPSGYGANTSASPNRAERRKAAAVAKRLATRRRLIDRATAERARARAARKAYRLARFGAANREAA